jgi:hypothetical protein
MRAATRVARSRFPGYDAVFSAPHVRTRLKNSAAATRYPRLLMLASKDGTRV